MIKPATLILLSATVFIVTYVTTDFVYNQGAKSEMLLHDTGISSLSTLEIVGSIATVLCLLSTILFCKMRRQQKEIVRLTCTRRVPVQQYEIRKKRYTEDSVRELLDSLEYKKYVDNKKKNLLKNVELTESDNIILSDDSSIIEEEKIISRQ